jgi:hypothetical protein
VDLFTKKFWSSENQIQISLLPPVSSMEKTYETISHDTSMVALAWSPPWLAFDKGSNFQEVQTAMSALFWAQVSSFD